MAFKCNYKINQTKSTSAKNKFAVKCKNKRTNSRKPGTDVSLGCCLFSGTNLSDGNNNGLEESCVCVCVCVSVCICGWCGWVCVRGFHFVTRRDVTRKNEKLRYKGLIKHSLYINEQPVIIKGQRG